MQATEISASPPTEKPESKSEGFITQLASLTALIAFLLYMIGFIIWRTYLAKFGVASVGFLQTEYISAAFCYLAILLALGLPAAVVLYRWFLEPLNVGAQAKLSPLVQLLPLWPLVIYYLLFCFFPVSKSPFGYIYWNEGHLAGYFILFGMSAVLYWREFGSPSLKLLGLTFTRFCVLSTIISLLVLSTTELPIGFLIQTMGISFFYFAFTGIYTPPHVIWKSSHLMARITVVVLFGFLLLLHVESFGATVFGVIPRIVGGGKPEKAFLQVDPEHTNLISALNITNTTNGLIGPVAILLQSDKGIIFVDYEKLNAPSFYTNITRTGLQDITYRISTNLAMSVQTNYFTNFLMYYDTNVVTGRKLPPKSKQVRSELVNAIIYSD